MVSLIIPCYNAEKYIQRCLNSVLLQSNKHIQLIIVNDGSRDLSENIILNMEVKFKQELDEFIYIKQDNQGVGAACNNAFKYATGEFVMLLDSDDIILPNSIELCVKFLKENEKYGFVRTNGYYVQEDNINERNRVLEVNDYMKNKENIFEEIFYGKTYVWPGSYMIRMSILEKLYPTHEILPSRGGQNLQFLMMAAYISKAGFIDKPLMCYTLRKESLSHFNSGNKLEKEINAMIKYKSIRIELIDKFMNGTEKEFWNLETEKLYDVIFLSLACKYKNKVQAKKYYDQLKMKNKKIDVNNKIIYYDLMNPFLSIILKSYRKVLFKVKEKL